MASITLQYDLTDDSSNDNPVAGLRDRFRIRLGRMLGTTVTVPEAQDSQTINIYVAPKQSAASSTTMDGDQMQRLIEKLQDTMQEIAWSSTEGRQKEETSHDQWDIILVYVSSSVHDTIMRLQATFKENIKQFGAVVAQVCGLDDVDELCSSLDTGLGDSIIRLQQLANSYGGTLKQQNELIEFSWTLLQRRLPDVGLTCLLGSTFSNRLYDLIRELTHPLNAHHTLVRTASTFLKFRTVNIHLGPPPPSVSKAISSPLKTSTPPQQPQSLQLHGSSPPPRNMTPSQGTMMDTILRYLPKEDRGLGLVRLHPVSKLAAALLIGHILHGLPVPPGSETYYLFGFTTCDTKKEEGDLADYYRRLLRTGIEPTIVFASISKALEYGTLLGLLRNKAGPNLDEYFPALQRFLKAQPEKRLSVHRLVQFLRDEDNDEPLPCLKRDFGFKYCTQREHVVKLKALYVKVINKGDLGELHYACTFGRLLDHAVSTLGSVEKSMRRLLQNDYPNPSVGYDNSHGLETYMGSLFKRSLYN